MAFRIPFPLLLVLPFVLLIYLSFNSPAPSHAHPSNPKGAQGRSPAALVKQGAGQAASGQQPLQSTTEDAGNGVLSSRIIAVGDIHGDLPRLMKVLRRAGVVDLKGYWVGGETILVQTGDIVDRGPDTIAIYRLFQSLRLQAEKVGGAVVSLLGNHEIMNALGDWRYVDPGDIETFGGERNRREAMLTGWIGQEWRANYSITARVPALVSTYPPGVAPSEFPSTPSGSSDRRFLSEPLSSSYPFSYAATSFVHGGITPEYLDALRTSSPIEEMNAIGSSILYMLLNAVSAPLSLPPRATPEMQEFWSERGPMWNRDWALEEEEEICERVDRVLEKLKVRRLVMGHTPSFDGILARCNGKVLLIDTGISRAYDGPLSSLEILHTLTPPSALSISEALEFGILELNDPLPEETLRGMADENGGKVKWLEREVVRALYTEERPSEELSRLERVVELGSR